MLSNGDYCCKTCIKEYKASYYLKNKERLRAIGKQWSAENKDKTNARTKKYYYAHQEKNLLRRKNYRDLNKELIAEYRKQNRARYNAHTAKYKAKMICATPKWLTEVDYERIKNCYKLANIQTKLTGSQWHVDHIYPLQGKEVCGLHVPNNLRAIPWLENVKKGNKLIEEKV